MRSFYLSGGKRVRGKRRRCDWLRRWAECFEDWFPLTGDFRRDAYCNWKLPVNRGLVEGRHARDRMRICCARHLLNAAERLSRSKPDGAGHCRIVAMIGLPDMFGSEVCVYSDEEYFHYQTNPVTEQYRITERIEGRSLARRWGIRLPDGFRERGLRVHIPDDEDGDYRGEWWFWSDAAEW